jgi:hypothetical protein
MQAAQNAQAARLESTLLNASQKGFELFQVLGPVIELRLEGNKPGPIVKSGLTAFVFGSRGGNNWQLGRGFHFMLRY